MKQSYFISMCAKWVKEDYDFGRVTNNRIREKILNLIYSSK